MLTSLKMAPIVQHAQQSHTLELEVVDIRNYADGSYRHIDDSPYGGGAGMIIRCEPVLAALESIKTGNSYVVCPVPAGTVYTQNKVHKYAAKEHLILIAGHYEGLDARIYNACDELISIGDYVISGGEYACMIIADSVVRLLDGVIKKKSTEDESFENGLLEYPQYTRPADCDGQRVPAILLSGDHEAIRKWRLQQSLKWTEKYRPDLLEKRKLTEEEYFLLHGFNKKL